MRRSILYFLLLLLAAGCRQAEVKNNELSLDLNDGWEFRQAGGDICYPATVPGTVHTDLLANGLIEDPFYRLNENNLQWIDKQDWEYRKTLSIEHGELSMEHVELIFEGLDTYADVLLNDSLVLQAGNMFRTWRTDVKRFLREGENTLLVRFRSPTMAGLEKLEAHGYPLPASNDQSENGEMGDHRVSPFVRKAPYHFGWDWGPRLVTSGIWRPVRIEASDGPVIEDVFIRTLFIGDKTSDLQATITLRGETDPSMKLRLYIDGKLLAESPVSGLLQTLPVEVNDPELWWPNGMGKQKLYGIRTVLVKGSKILDERIVRTGIRTVELVREPDGDGETFYFRVNGVPLFAKGANYIPNDVFLPRVTPERYDFIVRSARDANMNMLRVWGGGVYENDLFYELCDQNGILVWQDFMFACSMYPGDDEFLDNVRQEAEDNIRRLRNHPSIALWCGNNEIEVAWAEGYEGKGWGWKEMHNEKERMQIWMAYDTLFHHILPAAVEDFDPGKPYWHSSPSAGMGMLAGYDSRSGDMHYWGVWHGMEPIGKFREVRARFMSEYGFQSFPEFSSVRHYTLPEDWDIDSEVMKSHQRSGIGNQRILQYMEADYPVPDDFEQFLYVGQLLQAEAIRTAIESHRAAMPYCMGSLYWQINDCWPVASWSGIDYYGRWKALHYSVREAFKQVALVLRESGDSLSVIAVSDDKFLGQARLDLKLMDLSGRLIRSDSSAIKQITNGSMVIFQASAKEFLKNSDRRNILLVSLLSHGDSTLDMDYHYFASPKDLLLVEPGIEVSITDAGQDLELTLSSRALAKNVFLLSAGNHGQFSNNFFDLVPGYPVKVRIRKQFPLDEFKRDLRWIHLRQTAISFQPHDG